MNKYVLFLLFGASLSLSAQRPDPVPSDTHGADSTGKYIAFLVGVGSYPLLPAEAQLRYPVEDIRRLFPVLENYQFGNENSVVLENPTRDEFWVGLKKIEAMARPQDRVLFFFSLHGKRTDTDGQYFWLPADARPDAPDSWINVSDVQEALAHIKYKQMLFLVDACYGGRIFNLPCAIVDRRRGGTGARGISVPTESQIQTLWQLSASKAITSGTEMQEVPDNSLFFESFLAQLDSYSYQYLLANDLFGRVQNTVMSRLRTIPMFQTLSCLRNEQGADFIFFRPEGMRLPQRGVRQTIRIEKNPVRLTLDAAQGQIIRISASGTIYAGHIVKNITPAGKDFLDNRQQIVRDTINIHRGFPHGALLYRIREKWSHWKLCSDLKDIPVKKTGETILEFAINARYRADYEGAFTIEAEVK